MRRSPRSSSYLRYDGESPRVYLPPLRDAAQGLRPNRNSQLARLLHLLTDEAGRDAINTALKTLDETLKQDKSIQSTHTAISARHNSMMGFN